MATIRIRRTNDYMNLLRDYRLYIDGQKIGTIGNSQSKDFEIPAGQHSVIARIDWCSSQEISFEINENDSKTILVSSLKIGRWLLPLTTGIVALSLLLTGVFHYYITLFLVLPLFLIILYPLTIGRKNYLTLNELM